MYTIPTTYLNNTDEAKVVAKTLGAAEKAEFKPVQAATKSAAPKQADTKQKIKTQAAAAKEDAPVSTPVTPSPHPPCSAL